MCSRSNVPPTHTLLHRRLAPGPDEEEEDEANDEDDDEEDDDDDDDDDEDDEDEDEDEDDDDDVAAAAAEVEGGGGSLNQAGEGYAPGSALSGRKLTAPSPPLTRFLESASWAMAPPSQNQPAYTCSSAAPLAASAPLTSARQSSVGRTMPAARYTVARAFSRALTGDEEPPPPPPSPAAQLLRMCCWRWMRRT